MLQPASKSAKYVQEKLFFWEKLTKITSLASHKKFKASQEESPPLQALD